MTDLNTRLPKVMVQINDSQLFLTVNTNDHLCIQQGVVRDELYFETGVGLLKDKGLDGISKSLDALEVAIEVMREYVEAQRRKG